MLVLLPPSESKSALPTGSQVDMARVSFAELTDHRLQTLRTLAKASASPDALKILKVTAGAQAHVAANTSWDTAVATPVYHLYSGVLFDALGRATLTTAARKRVDDWCVVMSAAWGALRMNDAVAPYRLSMSVNLPPLGPLATWWRPALSEALASRATGTLVVDCRSSSYAAAYTPRDADWVGIRVFTRGPGGLKPVSHHAKHTRGEVVRFLASHHRRPPTTGEGLASVLGEAWEVTLTPPTKTGLRMLNLVVAP